ncbi:unnamed protein product [Fraxinus pennsylvanica]|uniref:START domain-containing protein n=1 Tax=Fraxinus pennsylvanica TaxID=56036 RepID=A0AAD1YYV1_9LAMI|nr:unnamed protein product [Fraxinus pennsylvanica]
MKRRDLLLRRYWRREDDGTYVILYHSVFHRKCPPQRGYVRAYFKSGGFVISPVKQGKKCVVKHMLAVDWRIWKSYVMKASARTVTISFLERVGALRELFRVKGLNNSHEIFSGEITREIGVPHCEEDDIKTEIDLMGMEIVREDEPRPSNLMGLNGAVDEFFDVPEPSDDERSENERPLITNPILFSSFSFREIHFLDKFYDVYTGFSISNAEISISICNVEKQN